MWMLRWDAGGGQETTFSFGVAKAGFSQSCIRGKTNYIRNFPSYAALHICGFFKWYQELIIYIYIGRESIVSNPALPC